MVMEGVEPSTVALLAQRSNQLSYTTFLAPLNSPLTNIPACIILFSLNQSRPWPQIFSLENVSK